jgi:DNA-binding GntR family transcriptional regulator
MTLDELRARFPALAADRRLLRNDVYAILLAGITAGDLAPGERLKDAELTEALRVSRTPVREAMSRLSQVGLIHTAPNRYTLVAPMDDAEMSKVIGVLRMLLPSAIRNSLDEPDVDTELELTVIAERLERDQASSPIDALQRTTAAFLDGLRDRVLAETIETLLPRFIRYVALSEAGARVASRGRVLALTRALAASDEAAIDAMERMLSELAETLTPSVGGPA